MISIFTETAAKEDGYSYLPFLYPYFGKQRAKHHVLNNAFDTWISRAPGLYKLVDDVRDANLVLAPNDFSYYRYHSARFHRLSAIARDRGLPLVIMHHGDRPSTLDEPHVIALNTSIYRRQLIRSRAKLWAMPAYTNDVLTEEVAGPLQTRPKNQLPIVGFCGWAQNKDSHVAVKQLAKSTFLDLASVLRREPSLRYQKQGLQFRAPLIRAFIRSDCLTNFLLRDAYFNGLRTEAGLGTGSSFASSRAEYIDNLLQSDYTLCVKGDGNYSFRFYESLCVGRLPLFIDTDCVLPFEDEIEYNELFPRFALGNAEIVPSQLLKFHASLSVDEFTERQRRCRDLWEESLSPHGFFSKLCRRLERSCRTPG